MQRPTDQQLLRAVISRTEQAGCGWNQIVSASDEIVVFGSRATGAHRRLSDLDILCIGDGRRIKNRTLDLLWLPCSALESEKWLGSELAGHVAEYGIWLKGRGEWQKRVHSSEVAIHRKQTKIARLVKSVDKYWNCLHVGYQVRYQTTLRREIQRLMLLWMRTPVPPTPSLDSEWKRNPVAYEKIRDFLKSYAPLMDLQAGSSLVRKTFEI